MILNNVHEAKKFIVDLFKEKRGVFSIEAINQGKRKEHFEIYSEFDIYYCLYKRNFFFQFGQIFSQKGMRGAGESINNDVLSYILEWSIDWILFIYPDSKVYQIDPKIWQKFVQVNQTMRYTENMEYTTSVPVKLLDRFVLQTE